MQSDPRIEWMRENIPGFAAINDQAEAARKSVEENRAKMRAHMQADQLAKFTINPRVRS